MGRLEQSKKRLDATASAGSFPENDTDLIAVGNSIRDALDSSQISQLLGVDKSIELTREVSRAMKGTVHQRERGRRPYQFQSQLWVGAMLHFADLVPTVPVDTGSKKPDYMISVVTKLYGVEVKRPESEAAIERSVRGAAQQLSSVGLSGVLAIDVSDCVVRGDLERISHAWDGPPYVRVLPEYARMRDGIGRQVYDATRRGLRPGYGPVMVTMILARGYHWNRSPDAFGRD
ncbi:MAG TPA: hypothetical protein VF785_01025 [Gemmatimonadaceae bacterium]